MKMMRLFLLTFLLSSALTNTKILHAVIRAPYHLGCQVECLYLLPSIEDTNFVLSYTGSSSPTVWKMYNNPFSFQPGIRVAGSYIRDNCHMQGDLIYTRLFSQSKKRVTVEDEIGEKLIAIIPSNIFNATMLPFVSATSHLSLLYQDVEIRGLVSIWSQDRWEVAALGGIEYASIHLNEQFSFYDKSEIPDTQVEQIEDARGVGPLLGASLRYSFTPPILHSKALVSLFLQGRGAILISKTTSSNQVDSTTAIEHMVNIRSYTWRGLPVSHIRFGIQWPNINTLCQPVFTVGYEGHLYLRTLNRLHTSGYAGSGTIPFISGRFLDFSMQGLYIAIEMVF